MRRTKLILTAAGISAFLWLSGICLGSDTSDLGALEFREVVRESCPASGVRIPGNAVQVFTYEGRPDSVCITEKLIAVEYGHSGVLFDRKTGAFFRRLTIADGWSWQRPSYFASRRKGPHRAMVGPGVLLVSRPAGVAGPVHDVSVSVEFDGYEWKAMQPSDFLRSLRRRTDNDYKKMRKVFGSWTGILCVLNTESFLQAERLDGETARMYYTMKEGLASNIVTHLAVTDGKLWAACVDIYDPERKRWGAGGLCYFDPKQRKWRRVDEIDGRVVRWVTLLQKVGDALWVGFRDGEGVAGDKVAYGMGLYPGYYRPVAKSIVLACLSNGKWTTFSREPLPGGKSGRDASTETPRKLTMLGKKVFLFSETHARGSGNWEVTMDGHISLVDTDTGKWRIFYPEADFGVFHLSEMFADDEEIIAFSNRGAHRWLEQEEKWQFLDTQSPIINPNFGAAIVVGNQLWIGYTNQSFGVLGQQGISCYDEKANRWSFMSPNVIGTDSPVRGIVSMENNDVWVLFGRKEWRHARVESGFYPDEPWNAPEGLGRFRNGKWEFPVKLNGVPESRQRVRKGSDGPKMWDEKLPIQQIAGAGGKLFVTNAAGLYMGPGKWQRILEGSPMGIQPSENGKTLSIVLPQDRKLRRGLYDPATGKLSLSTVENPQHGDWQATYEAGYLLFHGGNDQWRQRWTRVPTRKQGQWVIGPLETAYHAVVQTSWATWIVSRGQLIRLDREILVDWLGDDRE